MQLSEISKCRLVVGGALAVMVGVFAALLISSKPIIDENNRLKGLCNKSGVITVYDNNRKPLKIDVHTLRYYNGQFICRIDYGAGVFPRFSEATFFESEIDFRGEKTK